ncbi:uncharacterized protein BDZ99DRAFT_533764 [Mytilinidion resinicola]|uniref:Zn(2)-C6 fungal-type domain-containing protein n=1 Tax=Mytilinidion resinicola TaxID=574789 RepID=A0A6A6YKV8_9PEZI|nr:uncharacterized protein BDZ99DRAFT_533764 [Mytilinidion resinicola]KAF2809168.1 hypothetical protein BDZ99DRAFT_533764 [Mytilinidion resinicola]
MVYRGKPSKGCAICRNRKKKWDQAVPECGQFVSQKRPCPGYRNQLDLCFVDQSSQVAEKVRKASPLNVTIIRSSPTESAITANGLMSRSFFRLKEWSYPDAFETFTQIPYHLSQSLDQLALNLFMTNYVGRDATQYQFDYLPDFYQQPGLDKNFSLSIVAVGLAGFAAVNNVPVLVHKARMKYSSAIRAVNLALASPDTAKKDSTLVSVMLLGMFEIIISPSQQSLEILMKHLNGAVELAKL